MEINLYHIDELAEKSGVSAGQITDWVDSGLFQPEGKAADSTPIFSEDSLENLRKIKSLTELGYNAEEIKKIIRKVGLPAEDGRKNRKLPENENYLTVGNLAEKIDVSPRTIKHWEEKGIIEPDLRSRGGFRLYNDYYVLLCNLIKDLQLFGYSLDEIKKISDFFRNFIQLRDTPESVSPEDSDLMFSEMEEEIRQLFNKMEQLKGGIRRWEDILKKHKKQISMLKDKNSKLLKREKNDKN